jgi:hypothetical protein
MIGLHFAPANAKLIALQEKTGRKLYSFSTLSGWTCPYAMECESRVVYNGNGFTIQDGKDTQFRCFSASQEVIFPAVREARLRNYELLTLAAQDMQATVDTILAQIPQDAEIIRLHVAGDFKSQNYFDAWLSVAKQTPHINYYAYTKSLPFWVARLGQIPSNFVLTASYGGRKDAMIAAYGLRYAKVLKYESEAKQLGLEIDHDDFHAYQNGPSFALLVHGIQPAGSEWGTAARTNGGSYSR